ncbi:hypothetical protein [Elizabethkingia anophelis]|uniref:hypothetical protein n=1 Tax=Elizabethkingia anophelis TaxID=1117645 RepID=UPI002013C03E|nr:hypothetical protein [Elizabethkingia anophelis]MCL1689403.1 hypothetical protein [Elizabethkingia anophelis]
MKIKDIVAGENYNSLQLYRQGVFWVGYEQSAYVLWLYKRYKVSVRYIKSLKRAVLSVGFADSVLDEVGILYQKDEAKSTSVYKNFILKESVDRTSFFDWRLKMTHTRGWARQL